MGNEYAQVEKEYEKKMQPWISLVAEKEEEVTCQHVAFDYSLFKSPSVYLRDLLQLLLLSRYSLHPPSSQSTGAPVRLAEVKRLNDRIKTMVEEKTEGRQKQQNKMLELEKDGGRFCPTNMFLSF